jgi:uncharacterized protein (TIGR02300 family)
MAELGKKYECPDCDVKFYDLGRPQALCPRCGRDLKSAELDEDDNPLPTRKVVEEVVAVEKAEDDEIFVDDVEADDEIEEEELEDDVLPEAEEEVEEEEDD